MIATQDKQALELLFCACIDGGTAEDYRALARQAEKIAESFGFRHENEPYFNYPPEDEWV